MQILTRDSLLLAVFLAALLLPITSQAMQIAEDAGQFAVQAQLVQNTCETVFSQTEKQKQNVTIKVELHGCNTSPYVLTIEGNNEWVRLSQPVWGPESAYYFTAHYLNPELKLVESAGGTLQVTYF